MHSLFYWLFLSSAFVTQGYVKLFKYRLLPKGIAFVSTSCKLLPHLKVPSSSVSRPTSPLIPCLIKPISHLSTSYVCPVWAPLRTKLYLLVYNPINLNRDKYVFPLPCHLHFSSSLEEIRENCSSPFLITLILDWSVLCFTLLPGLEDYHSPSWSEQGRVGKEIFPKAA